jgi:exosortase
MAGAGNYGALVALLLGALALYAPIWIDFAAGPWRRDENAHALVVMAIAIGAAASRLTGEEFPLHRNLFEQATGIAIVVFGLALAFAGVASETELLTSASQGVVATGVVALLLGGNGLKRLWFPLALTLYLVIWPGWALDMLTSPLKTSISETVSNALYAAGLPIAHSGAVISAGPYQLLVADACSGINSVIALTAVGAVYLYAARRSDWRINAIVIACLVPIALAANVVRVAALVLITYFLGYDAGQGFLHDGAGLLMFAIALALVFAIDGAAALMFRRRAAS